MRLNAKVGLVEMDESSNMKNGIRVEMYKLNPVEMEKATEEFSGWQIETTKEEGLKHDNLVRFESRDMLTSSRAPADDVLRRQDTVLTILRSSFFPITEMF